MENNLKYLYIYLPHIYIYMQETNTTNIVNQLYFKKNEKHNRKYNYKLLSQILYYIMTSITNIADDPSAKTYFTEYFHFIEEYTQDNAYSKHNINTLTSMA